MKLIVRYLFNPTVNSHLPRGEYRTKIKIFFSAFFFTIIGLIIWSVLITIIDNLDVLLSGRAIIRELLRGQSHNLLKDHKRIVYILILTVLAPIYEELEFRLFLDLKRSSLIVSFSLFIFFLFAPVWFLHISNPVTYLFAGVFFLILGANYFLIRPKVVNKIKGMNFKVIFYISVFLFGFVHIFNFKPFTITKIALAPILVLPQIIGGMALGYVRLKNGIAWSAFLHMVINCIGFLLMSSL